MSAPDARACPPPPNCPASLLQSALLRLRKPARKAESERGRLVVFTSSKPGSGASTLACQTAALLKKAKTDSDRRITYDPEARPEVSNLLLLASLCTGEPPAAIAERIGDGGSGTLKKVVTEALNDTLAPIRSRREALARDPDVVTSTLRTGIAHVNAVADRTLREARAAMNMDYAIAD